MAAPNPTSEDIVKILISTDLHLGFLEKDIVRGGDSFLVFEELLQLAVSQKADVVLLAGDIFHENRPSRYTLWRTMEILRTYVMGPTPIRIQIVSDYDAARVLAPTAKKSGGGGSVAAGSGSGSGSGAARKSRAVLAEEAAAAAAAARRAAAAAAAAAARAPEAATPEARARLFGAFARVNWEDPNYNVALPIFAIHGNHDDPSREGPGEGAILAPLDILAAASLVNYFGKAESSDSVSLVPVLLAKGSTRVALYGVGNIREDRMQRMFQGDKVRFRRPAAGAEEWFNLLLIHQNRDQRTLRTKTGALSIDECLPSFLDVVVWGHEHECITTTEHCGRRPDAGEEDEDGGAGRATRIIQPGSTVATSLCEGEARRKHAVILQVAGTLYRRVNVPLRCVRPFVMGELLLSSEGLDPDSADVGDRLQALLTARIEAMIREATHPFAAIAKADAERAKGRGAGAGAGAGAGLDDEDEDEDEATGGEMADAETQALVRYRPPPPSMRQPLIRLKVEHSGFSLFPAARFSAAFVGRVANPGDLLHLFRRAKKTTQSGAGGGKAGQGGPLAPVAPSQMGVGGLEDLVAEALAMGRAAGHGLTTVSQDALVTAVHRYAGGEAAAIRETVELAVATRKAKTGAHASITGADLLLLSTAKLRALAKDANAAMTEAEEEENANKTPAERARDAQEAAARLRAMMEREDEEGGGGGYVSDSDAASAAGTPTKGKGGKAAAKPRAKAAAKPRAKAAANPKGGAKAKKRGRGGDDEGEGEDVGSGDGDENEDDAPPNPLKRTPAAAKKATAKKKKAADDDDDDVVEVDDGDGFDVPAYLKPSAITKKVTVAAKKATPPRVAASVPRWPGTEGAGVRAGVPAAAAPAPAAAANPTRSRGIFTGGDDDD